MKNAHALLFDLDGTLVNSEIGHYKCWNALLESFGRRLEHEHYLKFYSGVFLKTNAQQLIDEFKIEVTLAELIKKRERLILETLQLEDIRLMPYAHEILTYFSRLAIPLVLVTSSSRAEATIIMAKTKLNVIFHYVVTRDDVRYSKQTKPRTVSKSGGNFRMPARPLHCRGGYLDRRSIGENGRTYLPCRAAQLSITFKTASFFERKSGVIS